MSKTIQEVSKETLAIEEFIKSCQAGDRLTFQVIEESTGVKMDTKGKGYLRTALGRLKLPCESMRGIGIVLLSPDNAINIVANSVIGIDNKVKASEKKIKQVQARVHSDLPQEQQRMLNGLASMFGSIRSFSEAAKKTLFGRRQIKNGEQIQ